MDYRNPFEFYAVLQKYDTPNRNGRFYPERILKREAENYKKIISKVYKNQKEENIFDVKGKTCDIIIDINSVWQFGEKTGVQFTVKTINILN